MARRVARTILPKYSRGWPVQARLGRGFSWVASLPYEKSLPAWLLSRRSAGQHGMEWADVPPMRGGIKARAFAARLKAVPFHGACRQPCPRHEYSRSQFDSLREPAREPFDFPLGSARGFGKKGQALPV
jgi:hypothetical protein